MDWHNYFYYDETSPSCLRWKVKRHGNKEDSPVGWLMGDGYWSVQIDYKSYLVHRIIWEMHHTEGSVFQIDHIDNVRTNNKLSNLRKITHKDNTRKRLRNKNNTTGYKGVYRKGNKFGCKITLDYISSYLGSFATAEDAARAYDAKAKEFFGEFAILNFQQ